MRNSTHSRKWALLTMLTITLTLPGCTGNGLKPAAENQQVGGLEDAARESVAGVSVLVQDAEWPGDAPIDRELTPLRVTINNRGGQPLRIAYSNFTLVSPQGLISSALPLYEIDGTVNRPVAIHQYSPIHNPGFMHTNFAVAPYLADIYPDVRSSAHPFHYDRYYYGAHLTHWEPTEMPTPEMRINALPEGVLERGGRIEGWLYFKQIEDADRVIFRVDLVNAESGATLGEIRIPFGVE